MLQIQCQTCKEKFWVLGYSTPNSWEEPGEDIISDKETFEECCEHIQNGGEYDVLEYESDEPDDHGGEYVDDFDDYDDY